MARQQTSKTQTADDAAASPTEPAAPDGEADGAAAAPSRPIKAKFGATGVIWLIAVVLLIGGGGYLTWPYLTGATAPPRPNATEQRLATIEAAVAGLGDDLAARDPAARLDALAGTLAGLDGRLGALGDRLEGFDDRLAAIESTPPADDGLAERLAAVERTLAATPAASERAVADAAQRLTAMADGLSDRLAALEGRLAGSDALAGRLDALEARLEGSGGAATMLTEVGELRDALRTADPYAAALAAVEARAGDDPAVAEALAKLASHAATGVPTVAKLRAEFVGLAPAIVRAAKAPEEGSWVDQTMANLRALWTVRCVGKAAECDTATEAIVARAEAKLDDDELADAIDAIETLEGDPAAAAADWLARARTRLDAEAALAALDDRAIAALGG